MGFDVMAKACETCIYRTNSPLDLATVGKPSPGQFWRIQELPRLPSP